MATVIHSRKSCSVNPLKMSQPIGGALAFMGLANCMPVLHGSQGCTAFGLVLFVRHFREAIPLQTTAMNEVTTIMGGMDNIEQALLNIYEGAKPEIIGLPVRMFCLWRCPVTRDLIIAPSHHLFHR